MPKDIPKMPDGLEDLLRGLSKAVLKEKPQNILDFSAKYFEKLLIERDGSLMKNYERFEHYEKSLNKLVNEKNVGGDSVKKIVKSGGKTRKTVINPKGAKRVQNIKPNDKLSQKIEKVPSPIFGDKVLEKETKRKTMETVQPRGKLKTRTRSSISLNAITEESSSEMKEERRMMYRNAVKKIQRAFRQYRETKKQKSLSVESSKSQEMDEDRAARIIQKFFKLKFPKKTSPQPRPRSIKNKNLERVAEGGEDSKSLLEYLQEEENAKKTQPNIEHDSDTGETTRVDGVKISNADSLENLIINEDMKQQNSKYSNQTVKLPEGNNNDQEQAAIKIQSTFRGYQARKDIKQQLELKNVTVGNGKEQPVPANPIEDTVTYKNNGEMELAAVKIQKNYRGYKVRKDILSTKNLVNSGNLVAAAGNIIGSVVNNLHSDNEFAEHSQLTMSDKHSENINSEETPTYEENSDDVNKIHGTVTETPELVNNDDKESQDSDSANTKSEVLLSNSVPEVSQNTSHDIEQIIGINEQERESESKTSTAAIAESSQIPEGTIVENTQITPDIQDDLVVVHSDNVKDEIVENNLISDRDSTLEPSAGMDTQHKTTTIIGANNLKQDLTLITTEATAIKDSTAHELLAVQENANHDIESVESLTASKHGTVSHATKATTIQDNPVLNSITNNNETPAKINNSEETESVINSTDQNHETEALPSELTNHQDDLAKIQKNNESANENKMDLNDIEIADAAPNETQPINLRIIPEVTIDGASEEILSDSELVDDNQTAEVHHDTVQQEKQENLIDLNNPVMKDAALIIQKTFRGHQVRQNLKEKRTGSPKLENSTVSSIALEEDKLNKNETQPPQTVAENEIDKPHIKTDENHEQYGSSPEHHIAALKIQKTYRGHQVRKELKQKNAEIPNSTTTVDDTKDGTENNVNHPIDKLEQVTLQKQDSLPDLNDPEIVEAALRIQKALMDKNLTRREHNHLNRESQFIEGPTTDVLLTNSNDDNTKSLLESENKEAPLSSIEPKLENEPRTESTLQTDSVVNSVLNSEEGQVGHFTTSTSNLADPEKFDAAVKIQKTYRGHMGRKAYNQKKEELERKRITDSGSAKNTNEKPSEELHSASSNIADLKPDDVIQSETTILVPEKQDSLPDLNDPEMADAALKIQKSFRGHQARKDGNNNRKKRSIELDPEPSSNLIQLDLPVSHEQINPLDTGNNTQNPASNQTNHLPNLVGPMIEDSDSTDKENKMEPQHTELENPDPKTENNTTLTPVMDPSKPEAAADIATQLTNNILAPEKQDSLPDLNDPEMAEAALKIQKSFRGHQARKDGQNIRKKRSIDLQAEPFGNLTEFDSPASNEIIDSLGTGSNQPIEDPMVNDSELTKENEMEPQQTELESRNTKIENITTLSPNIETAVDSTNQLANNNLESEKQDSLPDLNDPEMADAALKIQKSFRGHQARKDGQNIRKKRSINLQTEPSRNLTEFDVPASNEKIDSLETGSNPTIDDPLVTDSDSATNENEIEPQHIELESHDTKIENITALSPNMKDEPFQPETAVDSANQLASANNISASEKQDSLPDLNDPEMADAALKIQKSFRGHQARKDGQNIRKKRSIDLQPEPSSNLTEFDLPPSNENIDSLETGSNPKIDDPMVTDSDSAAKENEMQPQHTELESHDNKIENITTLSPNIETAVDSANQLANNISASEKQDSLPDLNDPDMAEAALKIQKSFRGHQARKDESINKKQYSDLQAEKPFNNLEISKEQIGSLEAENVKQNSTSLNQLNSLPNKDNVIKSQYELLENQDSLPDLNDPEMADAALKIQKSFRSHQTRKEFKQQNNDQLDVPIDNIENDPIDKPMENPANITEIQDPITLNSTPPMEKQESLPDLNDPEMANAALAIQKSFRVHKAQKDQMKSEKQKPIPTTESAADKPTDLHHTSIDQNQDEMLNDSTAMEILSDLPTTIKKLETQPTATSVIPSENNKVNDIDEHNTKIGHEDSLPDLNDPEMADAALKIQKSFRGHQARREIKERDKCAEKVDTSSEATRDMKPGIVYTTGDIPINNDENSSPMPDTKMEEKSLESATDINQEEMEHEVSAMVRQDSLPDLNDPGIADAALTNQKSFRCNDLTSDPLEASSAQIDNEIDIKPQIESLPNLDDSNTARKETPNSEPCINKNEKQLTKDSSDLPEVLENNSYATSHKDVKIINSVEKQDDLPDLNDAALKIQKSFRGHKVRKDTKENDDIGKILAGATAPSTDDIDENKSVVPLVEPVAPESNVTAESNILNNIAPDIITKATETAAINIQRTYRGYRTRRDLKSQTTSQLATDLFEDENKLVDSLEPTLDQKSEDKIDADSLDNFNVEEKTEAVEEPCQKIVYKSKLSMLIENSKSDTQSSSSDKIESKPNDDYFDSLENTQTSEMDESPQTVIEVKQPTSILDTSYDDQNKYDSSIFGLKIEPHDMGELEQQDMGDDSISRKTTAEIEIPDTNVETRGGMTDDEIKEIQNIDLAAFEKDSLEAMYYSLRKNELLIDQMHSLSNVEQISDQTEPQREFTAKQKLLSMGESDSDDIVFKQLSIDYDECSENSNQHTARSTTDDDADVEVVRDVLYYNDGKQILPDQSEVKREPGDGASVASDNVFDNHSNADDQEVLPGKPSAHHFEIFSLDEEIKNLESNVTPYQQNNPLFYAQQKIEKFLHQIHGNMNETEDDADDENDDDFLANPIDSNKSYLSENNFNAEDDEEDDVVDELRTDFRESSARKVLSSAVSEADSDYIEQSRAKPIKDDFNISTALDNYLSTDSDSTYNSAATKIQAGARGFLTRRRIQSINRQSISERRSSIGNAAIDQSLDDMIEENEERKKFKFHEAQSTFREDTITSSGETEMYGITEIKVEEKKIASPVTDSGNESTTSIDAETQAHLRNKYERFENESSFDAIDEDNLSDVVDVIRTSNVQSKLRSPIKNKSLSNINFNEYDRVATRRMTLQRGNAVQGNSTPSDEESKSHSSVSGVATTNNEGTNDKDIEKKTSYDSPIRRKSTDSASLMTKSSNSLPDLERSPKRRGFIQRQRTMPVQIETEIIRPLPKHMRKRIKSANSSAHSSQHASNLYKKKATY